MESNQINGSSEWLRGWRVSRAVNKSGVEGAELIAPVDVGGGAA